jgi:hypothetical protein
MSVSELLRSPGASDHIVQTYQDPAALAESVAEYLAAGLRAGEAGIVIARPEHQRLFAVALAQYGVDAQACLARGQLHLLDADETLARFMAGGMPQWKKFQEAVGGLIAEVRLQHQTVRAYGEMVDILWQQGSREAAIRLEEYWNDLGKLQTFSLFCAYFMDPLDHKAYDGPLQCVCRVHSHLIPTRDYAGLNEAVGRAAEKTLDGPLAQLLLSLAASHRTSTHMPPGQAALLWLARNMPRTAEKVLSEVRASTAAC